jgi:polar amino acid transport system substrate-binding protein
VSETLRVGAAFPDPPFEVAGAHPTGLDIELTQALAREMGLAWEAHRYEGADFDGIFAGLGEQYDVVASGATVTPYRKTVARWCDPYLRSGQSLVVDARRTPGVRSTHDLNGLVLGVQEGNTSEPVARRLHAEGKVKSVKLYAYDEIIVALDDLETGTIGAFMKLEPVMRWLTAKRPALEVVETGITTEQIAVAVHQGNALAAAINDAQRGLRDRGVLAEIGARWLACSDPHATAIGT